MPTRVCLAQVCLMSIIRIVSLDLHTYMRLEASAVPRGFAQPLHTYIPVLETLSDQFAYVIPQTVESTTIYTCVFLFVRFGYFTLSNLDLPADQTN